jgi:cytochrome P450
MAVDSNWSLTSLILPIVVLAVSGLAYVVQVTYRHRSRINELRKQGMPMPPGWSWIFGHSLVLLRYSSRLPPLANVTLALEEICREFTDTEAFILDMWPAYPPTIFTFNPEAAMLASNKHNLPKPSPSLDSIKPIVGGPTIISMHGNEWKTWRGRFSPGFSLTSLTEHIPYVVDCVQVFCDKLRQGAAGIILLDDLATNLTFDVITKVTL